MRNLDWTVIRTAATAALILIVPGAIAASYLLDGAATGWVWLFLAMIVAGFGVAGYVGGRLRPDTPMIHGGFGAVLAALVALLLGTLVALQRGDDLVPAAIVLALLLAAACGVAGALFGDWIQRGPTAAGDPRLRTRPGLTTPLPPIPRAIGRCGGSVRLSGESTG